MKKEFYETYDEASRAALALGVKSGGQYKKVYKQDSNLPANPNLFYADWIDWYNFLKIERPDFYETLSEASLSAQALGIKSRSQYKKGYKKDSRLPSDPERVYADDWVVWYEFLSIARTDSYTTLNEAAQSAQALGIKTSLQYHKEYKRDSRLPAHPCQVYVGDWVDWYLFLSTDRPEYYKTLAEASQAAQALGIQSSHQYKKYHKQDSHLPSTPYRVYVDDWVDWYDFLLTKRPNFYETLREASLSAQALRIRSSIQYKNDYKKDSRLPGHPPQLYADVWLNWYDFLGTERSPFYETPGEASQAAQALGIKSWDQYRKYHKQDSRLPARPDHVYAIDWDWYAFVGRLHFYETLSEAKQAAQALGFKSSSQYKKDYKLDSRLPANPDQVYAGHWVDWYDFLSIGTSDRFTDFEGDYPNWVECIRHYLEQSLGIPVKQTALSKFMDSFIIPNGYADIPSSLLHKDTDFNVNSYKGMIDDTTETQKRSTHNTLIDFFDYILKTYCSSEEDGELIRLLGFRNPLKRFLSGLVDSLPTTKLYQSNKPPLPLQYILRCRKYLFPTAAKSLSDVMHLPEFFKDDWVTINPALVDINDPNCITRQFGEKGNGRIPRRKMVTQIWSPVRAIALFTLLRIPLRGQQILWLDSGEADSIIPIYNSGKIEWVSNPNRIYGAARDAQGFIQPGADDSQSMYVTTNKTGRKVGGYSVPWMPEDLIAWIIILRDWQRKYNPINSPTLWTDIHLVTSINKKILQNRGSQVFLFRDPAPKRKKDGSPIQTATTFGSWLPRLLYKIQRDGEDLAELENKVYKSDFTPHSMRVSLITAYIVDGNVPVYIISKLVSHHSICMTIYYTIVGNSRMNRELDAAEKKALANDGINQIQDMINDRKIEELSGHLIATDNEMSSIMRRGWPASAYQFSDKGICPMGGAGCDTGGENLVERTTDKSIYAPVPSGHLGKRNCPRCRYFITGPAFLGGLVALGNEVALEISTVRREYLKFEEELQVLENEKYDAEIENIYFSSEKPLKLSHTNMEEAGMKLDNYMCDWVALNGLIQKSIALVNESANSNDHDKSTQLLVTSVETIAEVGLAMRESDNGFQLLSEICENAEIYTGLNAARAIPLRTQALDKMMDNNGLQPALYRLTEDQQLAVGNQMSRLLIQRLKSWDKVEKVISGNIQLNDLGDLSIKGLKKTFRELLGNVNLQCLEEA
ncbi:MAG: integrase [Colwellia sp.]|nr:integrase [Colwellia sp.]